MKKISLIIYALMLATHSFCQTEADIKAAADAAVKVFTWDLQKVPGKGTLMFLDVPYMRDGQDSSEYLTLTVAKDETQNRPAFISVIVPSNVVQSNGIFIKFGNEELEKGEPVRLHFEACHDDICTARIIDGYAIDEETKEKVDIFQKFLNFRRVYFLFIYPDGTHKSVAVPLFSFQEQYKKL